MDFFTASQVRQRKITARISTPNAPKAAASDGVTIPPTIIATITTMTPTMGTTSRMKRASFSPRLIGSTS